MDDTNFRSAIPIEKRVAIEETVFCTIGALFGVAKTTAVHIVYVYCEALVLLSDRFICFPSSPWHAIFPYMVRASLCWSKHQLVLRFRVRV